MSDDRDARGRFARGNPGGPGRPRKKTAKQISNEQLDNLTRELDPMLPMMLARELGQLEDTLKTVMLSDTHTDRVKNLVETEIQNRILAAHVLNKRLQDELH